MDLQSQTLPPNRQALLFIVVTVILNTLGFTLIVPVAPFLVARYVSNPNSLGVAVGWLSSIYAVCQIIAAPGLGVLSDRFGRRPLLLLYLFGSAVGYLLLGIGGALWILFLGRAIDGLTGANTSIIVAYITDVVPASQRSKYFGFLGAIGAACVVLGPAAGGFLAQFGYAVPFFVAGAVSFVSVLFGIFFMPESLTSERRIATLTLNQLNPLNTLREVFLFPQLRWLMIALFFYTLSTIILPSNLGLFTKDSLNWEADRVSILFSVFGLSSMLVQGLVLQGLLKWFKAHQVTTAGLGVTMVALLMVALISIRSSSVILYLGIIVFALGEGLTSPIMLELITHNTDEQSHGKVQGGSQSVQSLANVVGPVFAGLLYDHWGHSSPYVFGAGIIVLTFWAVSLVLPTFRK
jgi:DHA1 family tetracycline resistance protein-like MFS transporter